MKIFLLFSILSISIVGCNSNYTPHSSNQPDYFGKPFYGNWKGKGGGTILAPDIECSSVEVSVEPVPKSQSSLKIKKAVAVCNGKTFLIQERIFKINDGLVLEDNKNVGLSQKFHNNNTYSKDGRWFTFEISFPEITNVPLYASMQVFYYDNHEYSPHLFFDISTKADGSGRLIVTLSKPTQ